MEPATQRTRYGLGFEMIKECRSIAPDFIPADLDQSGTKHDAKNQPAEKNDHRHGGGRVSGKDACPAGDRGKIARKPVSSKLDFPAVSIPVLTYMHKDIYRNQRTASNGALAKPATTTQESRNPIQAAVSRLLSE